MSDIRQASLTPGEAERLPMLLQLGPFAILALAALWLRRIFWQLPDRIPVHWNLRGEADRFVHTTPLGVALPLLLGAAVCAMMVVAQVAVVRSAPRGALRRPVLKILLAAEYFGALVCCGLLAASVTAGRLLWPVVIGAFAGALALLVLTAVFARHIPKGEMRNPSAWRAGVFYVDRNDPALFVPKRFGFGYTLNFGQPAAILLAVAIVAVPLGIALLALAAR